MNTLRLIAIEMRPKQWTKNFFVFAALIFDGRLLHPAQFIPTAEMFVAFCLASSAVYFFNDIFDAELDRLNPKKMRRPIASGAISRRCGYFCSIVFAIAGLAIAFSINARCFILLSSYIALNVIYTVRLKHVVILDIMIVAACFAMRAVSGANASDIDMTIWFVLCVMFLSLFLIIGKRRDELFRLSNNELRRGRKVLHFYSLELLDQLMTITASALLMSYTLFVIDPSTREHLAMSLTVPLVLYGVFYYLYAVRIEHRGGSPDEMLWRSKPILATALIYLLYVVFVRNQ